MCCVQIKPSVFNVNLFLRKCHPSATAQRSALEEGISAVRVVTQDAYDAVLAQTKQIDDFIAIGREHTRCK